MKNSFKKGRNVSCIFVEIPYWLKNSSQDTQKLWGKANKRKISALQELSREKQTSQDHDNE